MKLFKFQKSVKFSNSKLSDSLAFTFKNPHIEHTSTHIFRKYASRKEEEEKISLKLN